MIVEDGIVLRTAVATAMEIDSDERIAELLLSNAADEADYQAARQDVIAMGLDPHGISHP